VSTLIRIYYSRSQQSSFVQFASVRAWGIKFTPVSSVIPLAKLGVSKCHNTCSASSGAIAIPTPTIASGALEVQRAVATLPQSNQLPTNRASTLIQIFIFRVLSAGRIRLMRLSCGSAVFPLVVGELFDLGAVILHDEKSLLRIAAHLYTDFSSNHVPRQSAVTVQ
jgi:hypothetical protein